MVGVIQLLIEAKHSVPRRMVVVAMEALDVLAENDEWLRTWRDPAKIKSSVVKWRNKLRFALDNTKLDRIHSVDFKRLDFKRLKRHRRRKK